MWIFFFQLTLVDLNSVLKRERGHGYCLLIAPSFLAPGVARYQLRSLLGCHLMIAIPRMQCTVQAIYMPKTVRKPRSAKHNPPQLSYPPIAGSSIAGRQPVQAMVFWTSRSIRVVLLAATLNGIADQTRHRFIVTYLRYVAGSRFPHVVSRWPLEHSTVPHLAGLKAVESLLQARLTHWEHLHPGPDLVASRE